MSNNVSGLTDPIRMVGISDDVRASAGGIPFQKIAFCSVVGVSLCSVAGASLDVFSRIIGFNASSVPVFLAFEKGVGLLLCGFSIFCIVGAVGLIVLKVKECFQRIFPFSGASSVPEISQHELLVRSFSRHYRANYESNREQEEQLDRELYHGFPYIERETIPDTFDDDPILDQYRCPITRAPIRHVVIDPTSGRMYERAAIEEWIGRYHISPLTRRPLEIDDLAPASEVQAIIDNQLRQLQEEWNFMEQQIDEYIEGRRQNGSWE